MHLNPKQLAVSMAVGAVMVSAWYPANLNAITSATNNGLPIETNIPIALAQTIVEPIVGERSELVVQEPDAIDIWLEKLAYQESRDRADIKILDVNGKYSYGCLQFQEGTFLNYGVKYGLISPKDKVETNIYNCNLQKQIAKLMIKENYSNWRAWYNSSQDSDVGLPPKK